MSAPESSHELSVVSDSEDASSGAAEPSPKAAPPSPTPEPKPAGDERARRRGAPWWLVVVVAVIGVLLFLNQYQRAEGLDARVNALTEELLVADEQLEVANAHIAAHQTHLDRVRVGVADLSDQVAGLQALANRDPLAPAPVDKVPAEAAGSASAAPAPSDARAAREEPAAAARDASASESAASSTTRGAEPAGRQQTPPPAPEAVEGALTDSDGYYWRAEGAPKAPATAADAERRAVLEATTGTSFAAP
jgi:hypothetical protein